jgi:hypothetical protein
MRRVVLLIAVVSLAGCAAPAGRDLPSVIGSPVPGAAPAPLARGEADFTVRTVSRGASGREFEIGGIDCTATSGDAVAAFRSPARVILPDTGQGIRVVCAGGGRSGEAWVEARQAFARGGWRAAPSIGLSIGSGGRVGTGIGIGLAPVAVPAGVTYDDVRVALR